MRLSFHVDVASCASVVGTAVSRVRGGAMMVMRDASGPVYRVGRRVKHRRTVYVHHEGGIGVRLYLETR